MEYKFINNQKRRPFNVHTPDLTITLLNKMLILSKYNVLLLNIFFIKRVGSNMIILYIPFISFYAGDLTQMAKEMKANIEKNHKITTKIVYYNDEIDEIKISKIDHLFVLGHGFTDTLIDLSIFSNSFGTMVSLSPEEVAKRFSQDFLLFAHQIKNVHLYSCGKAFKNLAYLESFKASLPSLMLTKFDITAYYGSVLLPDKDGVLKSRITGGSVIDVQKTALVSMKKTELRHNSPRRIRDKSKWDRIQALVNSKSVKSIKPSSFFKNLDYNHKIKAKRHNQLNVFRQLSVDKAPSTYGKSNFS